MRIGKLTKNKIKTVIVAISADALETATGSGILGKCGGFDKEVGSLPPSNAVDNFTVIEGAVSEGNAVIVSESDGG